MVNIPRPYLGPFIMIDMKARTWKKKLDSFKHLTVDVHAFVREIEE